MSDTREVLRIHRAQLTEGLLSDGEGRRCALGHFVVSRGGDTALDREGFTAQSERIFADVLAAHGGSREHANAWSQCVMKNNNTLRGRARETALRALFARVGVRLVFTGKAD